MRFNMNFILSALLILMGLSGVCQAQTNITVGYTPYRFEPSEGWRISAPSNAGTSAFEGRVWRYDFSQGAVYLGLTPPDRSLLTWPDRFHLRVLGQGKGHQVHIYLRTHFMTFHKVVGELAGGSLPQDFMFHAPPGEGWQWSGGENDGKLHGPLRLGEIRLEANGHPDQGSLEMVELKVDGHCPTNKLCSVNAEEVPSTNGEMFRITVECLSPLNLEGALKWAVRNWDGRELQSGHAPLELPGIGNGPFVASNSEKGGLIVTHHETNLTYHLTHLTYDVPIPKLPKDLRFAEAEFELAIPGQNVSRAQTYWLAPMLPREDARLEPESPFGMGVYLGRYNLGEMEGIARKARDVGVKWSREGFSWSRIEPRPGEFHWEYFDGLLDCAQRNGISVYALVSGWAPWSKAYTPEGMDQYVAFLRQLVSRYHQRIRQWEVWNEPNIFFWQGPKELYAELLKKSYAAVKEIDPKAQVLGISTAGLDFKFIDKVLKQGAPFDVLTIHPYRKQLDDHGFISDLKKSSEQVKLADGTIRPIWLTEIGWTTHVPHHVFKQDFEPVTERVQAELLARVYLCALGSDIDPRTFWYDFRDDGADPFYFEHNLGTLRHDGRPKPAYLAFATLTALLEGKKFVGAVDVAEGVFAFRFRGDKPKDSEVLAVWNPKSDARVELKLPAKRVRIVNTIGEATESKTRPSPSDSSTRLLSLELKAGAPVYVIPL